MSIHFYIINFPSHIFFNVSNIAIFENLGKRRHSEIACKKLGTEWKLPDGQNDEDDREINNFMKKNGITSAWMGIRKIKYKNWRWTDKQDCKLFGWLYGIIVWL